MVALVMIAGFGQIGRGVSHQDPDYRREQAEKNGNRLFYLALVIPAAALCGTLLFKEFPTWIDSKQVTLISLALGVILALVIGLIWLRPKMVAPLEEGRRLMDSVGWAAVLPQMLASLGAVFALAGVGDIVGGLMLQVIPEGSKFGAVLAFGFGMALFTMIMGNAFAAFPVMASAIALPLLLEA